VDGRLLNISLIFLVLTLGLRHGLDADHLAYIDGQTRFNWRVGSPIARWVGTLFSFGHGLVVAGVAVILGMFAHNFKFPDYFDTITTWVSIISLFLIGTLNVYNLLNSKSKADDFQIRGIKGKFIPRFAKETTNPIVIIFLGGLFAMAADTVSQTSVWAIAAAGDSVSYMPLILGLVFMVGMMTTDTIDSLVTYRMVSHSGQLGQSASRLMGWVIVILAYGVSSYEAITIFTPSVQVNFETVGIVAFLFLIACYLVALYSKRKDQPWITDQQ
jgi:nickel/cobalt transporter (NiCoT) family protein